MSKSAQTRLRLSKNIPRPTEYIRALWGECAGWVFDEEKASSFKGEWRKKVFGSGEKTPLNLEIGPGNGLHFVRLCRSAPAELFLAVELKYKPLIQTARRLKAEGVACGRAVRYNAALLERLFAPLELNRIYIHFPDPWPKRRQSKHRLITENFVKKTFSAQRPGAGLELKTDDQGYLLRAKKLFCQAGYVLREYKEDLWRESAPPAPLTGFEGIFVRKNIPIGFLELKKP